MTCCHVKLRSVKVQVRSKRLGQVWFSLELNLILLSLTLKLDNLLFIIDQLTEVVNKKAGPPIFKCSLRTS